MRNLRTLSSILFLVLGIAIGYLLESGGSNSAGQQHADGHAEHTGPALQTDNGHDLGGGAEASSGDWCSEHRVPESACTRCRPELAAAFQAEVQPGEFLLIAPSRDADVYGIVGGAFLSGSVEADRCDCYVFLRADVNHVALHR